MRRQLRPLLRDLARAHPELHDPEQLIRAGGVLVNGFPATNPASLVAPGSVALRRERPLRGEAKLRAALDAFSVEVAGRTAPQFELGLAEPPRARRLLDAAVTR